MKIQTWDDETNFYWCVEDVICNNVHAMHKQIESKYLESLNDKQLLKVYFQIDEEIKKRNLNED